MKSRQGFVSNSSSSSFVLLGVKAHIDRFASGDMAAKAMVLQDLTHKIGLEGYYNYDESDGQCYVGRTVGGDFYDDMDNIFTLQKVGMEVLVKLNMAGYDFKEDDIRLYGVVVED